MHTRKKFALALGAMAGAVVMLAMVPAVTAQAASLPSCSSSYHCTANPVGTSTSGPGNEAGYYGKNDNQTHYRYVQTITQAEPSLLNLSTTNGEVAGAGAQLCATSSNFGAQTGVVGVPGTTPGTVDYEVLWAYGSLPALPANFVDPCIQSGLLQPDIDNTHCPLGGSATFGLVTCGRFNIGTIATGDHILAAVYYTPGSNHHHQISFGDCVVETGNCDQAYSQHTVTEEFTEFGIGAFSPLSFTAPPDNLLDTFASNEVTCYSCPHMVPITAVTPVNQIGAGGLYEADVINGSSQPVLSPNDSLSAGADTFAVYNGSTSS